MKHYIIIEDEDGLLIGQYDTFGEFRSNLCGSDEEAVFEFIAEADLPELFAENLMKLIPERQ